MLRRRLCPVPKARPSQLNAHTHPAAAQFVQTAFRRRASRNILCINSLRRAAVDHPLKVLRVFSLSLCNSFDSLNPHDGWGTESVLILFVSLATSCAFAHRIQTCGTTAKARSASAPVASVACAPSLAEVGYRLANFRPQFSKPTARAQPGRWAFLFLMANK